MTARLYLRTHDLALAGHFSVQQVRKDAGEWLDPASRASSERLSPLHASHILLHSKQYKACLLLD